MKRRTGSHWVAIVLAVAWAPTAAVGPARAQVLDPPAGEPPPARSAPPGPVAPPASSPVADNDYRMATYYYGRGEWSNAAEEFARFVRTWPTHRWAGDAQFGLAQSLFQLARYAEAAAEFEKLATAYPGFDKIVQARFQLGQAYMKAGQLERAAAAFGRIADAYPAHYLAEWSAAMQAECLINLARYDQAEPLLAPLVERYARGDESARRLAERRGALEQVSAQLPALFDELVRRAEWNLAFTRMGRKRYAESAAGFAEFVARNPTGELSESARFYRAQALYFDGQHEQAAAAYLEVVKQNGASAPRASLERALSLHRAGKLKEAAAAFIESARDFPNSEWAPRARLYAGTCLYEAADFDGAIHQFDAMIQSDRPVPTSRDEAAYWKGMAQLKLNRADAAARTFAEAVKAHPNSRMQPEFRLGLADALLIQDRLAEAAAAYEAFVAAFGQHESTPKALYSAAAARNRARQWAESSRLCAAFLANYPSDPRLGPVLFLSAENQFRLGQYAQAAQAYRQLLDKFDPATFEQADKARLGLGWCLYYQKQYEQALAPLGQITDGLDERERGQAMNLKANCLFELKRDAEAEKAFGEYLAQAGEKSYADDALFKLAQVNVRQDQPEQAAARWRQLLAEHPDSPLRAQAGYELAGLDLLAKRYEQARRHYADVIQSDRGGTLAPYAAFGSGLCLYEQGQFKEAADEFARIVRTWPEEKALVPQTLYRLGLSFQKLGQWSVAENSLGDLIARYPNDPYAPAALEAIGLGQQKQDNHAKAAETFARLIREYPQSPRLDQAYYELAWSHSRLGNQRESQASWRALAGNFPTSPLVADAYYHLADRHYADNQFKEAAELYGHALAAARDDRLKDKALYRLGWCAWLQGRFAESAESFDRLVNDHPTSELFADSLLNAGDAWLRADRPSEAADRLSRLVDGPAGQGFKHLTEAALRLGEAQLALRQPEKAIATFRGVREKLADAESQPAVDLGIARAMIDLKQHAEAIELLTEVLQAPAAAASETAAKAQYFIGEAYLARNQQPEALKSYLRVTVLYPGYPEPVANSLYRLGWLYLQMGEPAEAAAHLNALIEKYPRDRNVEPARKLLEQIRGQ